MSDDARLPRLEKHLNAQHLVWEGPNGLSFTRASYVWINGLTGKIMVGNPATALHDPAPAEEAAAHALLDRVSAAS